MTAEIRVRTETADETRAVGGAMAGLLRPGDVVALTGELGAGKTCLVQGAAVALGVTDPVTSPSFVLRRDYAGDVPVMHIDVYRLDTLQDVVDVGWDEALEGAAVAFIEWGDAMSPLLPATHLEVDLRLADGDSEARTIVFRCRGDEWRRRGPQLEAVVAAWREDG